MRTFDFYKLMQLANNPELFEQEREKILNDFLKQFSDVPHKNELLDMQKSINSKYRILKDYTDDSN